MIGSYCPKLPPKVTVGGRSAVALVAAAATSVAASVTSSALLGPEAIKSGAITPRHGQRLLFTARSWECCGLLCGDRRLMPCRLCICDLHETFGNALLTGRLQALKGSLGTNVMHGPHICCMLGIDTDMCSAARDMQQ